MEKRPNVIWIIADQLRQQALGCYGNVNARTPNIDQLSLTGARYSQAYSGFPLCCPFRGSLLTSKYPHTCVPGHEFQMPHNYLTIAAPFHEAGYMSAYFGKWHVDGYHESEGRAAFHTVPKNRRGGFDTWLGYDNNNMQWDSYVHGHTTDGTEISHYHLPGYETDALTDLCINYIKERTQDERPFFAVLSVQPPHDPYAAPARYIEHYHAQKLELRPNVPSKGQVERQAREELAGYYAQIENLDTNIGRVVDALHSLGLYHDTHIIFFSDHGDMHGSQGLFRKTVPFQEAIRIPFIISGTQTSYGGFSNNDCDVLLNHVDIAPTTLGLCGIPIPSWMEGNDFSGYRTSFSGDSQKPSSLYLQSVIPTGHKDSCDKPYRGIVTHDHYKYVCFYNQDWLLYNLAEDPYEQCNLAHNTRYADIRNRLRTELNQWVMRTKDEFKVPEATVN